MDSFAALGLSEPLLRALEAQGLDRPTPIQAQAIPALLQGRDMLGIAQTGTGKTAAFGLPMLDRLSGGERPRPKQPRSLVLAPTRELAIQIAQSFEAMGKHLPLRRAVVFGGVGMEPQIRALASGVDILVATPGRLLDLMERGAVRLDAVKILVLDEADRMLDMGFVRDVMRIVGKLPRERQSLLFSATMPAAIAELSAKLLRDPMRVEVTPETVAVDRIAQKLYKIPAKDKRTLLVTLLDDPDIRRCIVFTRTKRGADRVSEHLTEAGIDSAAIHGNKSQGARQKALGRFRDGSVRILVATDIAARGIDVTDVTHVVNFEMPNEPESYVHRIGRTARAGRSGVAVSFCDPSEHGQLKAIERLIRRPIPVETMAIPTTAPQRPAAPIAAEIRTARPPARRRQAARRAA